MKARALPRLQKEPVTHQLTTADLVRFMVAAFLIGIAAGALLADVCAAIPGPTPKVGQVAAR